MLLILSISRMLQPGSDSFYFLCLGLLLLCALLHPVSLVRLMSGEGSRVGMSMLAGFSATLGMACTHPFANARGLYWLPSLAFLYFGGILLSGILYAIAEPHKENRDDPPAG